MKEIILLIIISLEIAQDSNTQLRCERKTVISQLVRIELITQANLLNMAL